MNRAEELKDRNGWGFLDDQEKHAAVRGQMKIPFALTNFTLSVFIVQNRTADNKSESCL
jgi:hypothetical protein